MPYAYPSGRSLKENIVKKLTMSSGTAWIDFLKELGFSSHDIEEYRKSLSQSGLQSVDLFLEYRREFLDIGKLSIVLGIAECENEVKNLFFTGEQKWYEYLFNKLLSTPDDLISNKLSIVTFNYDRSLEYYLLMVMHNTFGKELEECALILRRIPIIHVYGMLSPLNWQNNASGTRYGYILSNSKIIEKASKNIIILSEGHDESQELKDAYDALTRAQRIYFLGFGYNDINLKRLKIQDFAGKNPFGTQVGIGRSDISEINEKWGIQFSGHNYDILSFLKNIARLN